jgi:hypothetical protein
VPENLTTHDGLQGLTVSIPAHILKKEGNCHAFAHTGSARHTFLRSLRIFDQSGRCLWRPAGKVWREHSPREIR